MRLPRTRSTSPTAATARCECSKLLILRAWPASNWAMTPTTFAWIRPPSSCYRLCQRRVGGDRPAQPEQDRDIAQSAHPRAFNSTTAARAFSSRCPTSKLISVVDRNARREIAAWPTGNGTHFAMALDHEFERLLSPFGSRRNAGVRDRQRVPVASVETCRDVDDMFVDANGAGCT